MKSKEEINQRIYELIDERGVQGKIIDHLKAKEHLSPSDEHDLSFSRSRWNVISAMITALEWSVDNVRFPRTEDIKTQELSELQEKYNRLEEAYEVHGKEQYEKGFKDGCQGTNLNWIDKLSRT